jgi:hypothetical protein
MLVAGTAKGPLRAYTCGTSSYRGEAPRASIPLSLRVCPSCGHPFYSEGWVHNAEAASVPAVEGGGGVDPGTVGAGGGEMRRVTTAPLPVAGRILGNLRVDGYVTAAPGGFECYINCRRHIVC